MTLRHPLWWIVCLYSGGIMAGSLLPGWWYLAASALLILLSTCLAALNKGKGWALLLFWFAFGGARISMPTQQAHDTNAVWNVLQDRAYLQGERLERRMRQSGLHGEGLSLGSALLLGRREHLSADTRKTYSDSGAAHLLALSGLHLGILYGLLHLLVIRRIRFSQWRWFAMPPLLLAVWGYAMLAGLPMSLVRAAGMCTVVMTASLAHRELWPTHALSLSALAILLVSPTALFSVSLQLSFLAVLFILTICTQPQGRSGAMRWLRQMLYISAAAQLGTAPLAAYYFHTLPLLSIPLSIILVPLTTLIVYLSLATLLVPVSLLATPLAMLVRLQNSITAMCAGMPGTVVRGLHPEPWHIAVVYAILLVAILRLNAYRDRTYIS